MARTFGDIIFKELNKINAKDEFRKADSLEKRERLLEQFAGSLNITKSSLSDLDAQYPNTSLYLSYLIQNEYGVDMGICPFFKIWNNSYGGQYRCEFNHGPKQVYCHASRNACENKASYEKNIETKMTEMKNNEKGNLPV